MSRKCTDCNGTGIVYTMDETDIGQTPGSSGIPCPSCSKQTSVQLKVGDIIRLPYIYGGTDDYTVEEFRQCLGIFASEQHREAEDFTPLCKLYEAGPDSEEKYISNFGTYHTNEVPRWMNIPKGVAISWTN